MKKLLVVFIYLLSVHFLNAQNFKGMVKDKETLAPIPFANVYLVNYQTGTTTDSEGLFMLKDLADHLISVQISFLGYQTLVADIDWATSGDQIFYLQPSHMQLDEVIVSVPNGRLQHESILQVDRKELSELDQAGPISLAEAISSMAGVSQRSTGAGIGKPVIRGLSSNRIVTYAQGIRVENQQWGDEHGLGVSAVGIESVELIKGPASLLYGADALGGVLYFVEERYAKAGSIEGSAQTRFQSNTLGTYNNVGFKINRGKVKWNLFGNYTNHADYKTPNEDRVYNSRFDEQSIKTAIGYAKGNWITNLRYSYLQNNFGIISEDSLYSNTTQRSSTLPFQVIKNHNLSWENVFFLGNDAKLDIILGYTGNARKEYEEDDQLAALDMRLHTWTYNAKWNTSGIHEKLDLIIGTQGMHQINENHGEERLVPDASTTDVSVFTLANIDLNKIKIQGGVRADLRKIRSDEFIENGIVKFAAHHQNYGSVNYSLGANYSQKLYSFRTNISSGFRAPNTSELLSNGVHEGTNQYVIGNPELMSENATQIDFSADYHSDHINISIQPFYNFIHHYIYLAPAGQVIEGSPVYEYLQTDAKLYGGEVSLHYHPHRIHWLHFQSSLSTVIAEDRAGNPLPTIPATNMNTTIKTSFSQKSKIQITQIFLNHTFNFDQSRIGEFETSTSNYHLLNVGASLEVMTKRQPIELTVGVKNLLNTEYIDHLSRLKPMGIANQGINFHLSIKMRFEGKTLE